MTSLAFGRGEIRGRHVLFAFIAFFGAIIVIDVVLVYLAVSTFSGSETDNAYRKGLAYNVRIEEEAAQARMGWTDTSLFDAATGELAVTISDRDGTGVDGLHVVAKVGRPATDVFDREVKLMSVGSGRYVGALPGLAEGTWAAQVSASEGEGRGVIYRSKARLWKQP